MDPDALSLATTTIDSLQANMGALRVAIVEDMQCFAQMLQEICLRYWDLAVITVSYDGASALGSIAQSQPDIVLLDLCLPDMDGISLAQKLNQAVPATRIIIVSGTCGDFQLHRLREVKIHGYLDKFTDVLKNLKAAVTLVYQGGYYFSPCYREAQRRLRQSRHAFFKLLSARQLAVLRLIAQALTDDEIADRLQLASTTVQTHRREIMHKLDIHSTPKLMHYAMELGIYSVKSKSG